MAPEEAGVPKTWPLVFQDSRQWCFLAFRPGVDPLKALVDSFLETWQFAATDPERVKHQNGWIELLRDGKATLPDLIDATERRRKELDQCTLPVFFLYIDQGASFLFAPRNVKLGASLNYSPTRCRIRVYER